jgi:hypothetical protein
VFEKAADLEVGTALLTPARQIRKPRAIPHKKEIANMLQPTLGSRTICAWCGNSFRLQRLAQRFCSPKCQKTGHRAEMAAGAMRSRTSITNTPVGGFCPKNTQQINGLQRQQPRPSLPFNLLGGHRWLDAKAISLRTWQAIVHAEIGDNVLDASTFAEAAE